MTSGWSRSAAEHDRDKLVELSVQEYQRLHGPREDFVSFMRRSPLVGVELDLQRDEKDTGRDVQI